MTGISAQALIMVVDDDVFERVGASDMFSHAGYEVIEAESADEALRLFETNSEIRLLFSDISMPGLLSGSDLANQVAERWPNVGIIMTSGRSRPDTLPNRTCFHAKPYVPSAVLRQAKEMTLPRG